MTIPLSNPLSTTETVLIGLLLLFFAFWGWRHGLDAAIIWLLFVIIAAWLAPSLASPLGKIINAVVGVVRLVPMGALNDLPAFVNAQSSVAESPVNVQDPNSSSMQIMTLVIFLMVTFMGYRYSLKKAGGKDSFLASLFGALGAMVVGYIIARFVLDRVFTFPQVVEVAATEFPPLSVNATVLLVIVLVLVVYGVLHSSKPPAKKG